MPERSSATAVGKSYAVKKVIGSILNFFDCSVWMLIFPPEGDEFGRVDMAIFSMNSSKMPALCNRCVQALAVSVRLDPSGEYYSIQMNLLLEAPITITFPIVLSLFPVGFP